MGIPRLLIGTIFRKPFVFQKKANYTIPDMEVNALLTCWLMRMMAMSSLFTKDLKQSSNSPMLVSGNRSKQHCVS